MFILKKLYPADEARVAMLFLMFFKFCVNTPSVC